MKEGQENIDKLFKKRLEDPANNLAYNEDDWDALEQMLDKGKKRPVIAYWLPLLSGIAALILLFLGWWLFKPQQVTVKPAQQVAVKPVPQNINSDTSGKNKPQVAVNVPTNNIAVNAPTADKNQGNSYSPKRKPADVKGATATPNTGATILAANGIITPQQNNTVVTPVQKDTVPPAKANMIAMQKDTAPPARIGADANSTQAVAAQVEPAKAPEKVKVRASYFGANRPRYALSVIASSDINGVNSFQQSKVGSNFGAMFSVSIKKWTITTGATYSVKPYATTFANYTTAYQFKQDPTNVTADCRMLDIPLNIGYQVYQKGKNKFSLGTGLSSYFMLHENYKYTYSSTYPAGPANYVVANPQNYLFSNLNLNATFEHRVNSKFSLSLQPYLKLPLKPVGYSQVNLHTAGVAVGFNWNINSFTKPK
ncbi:RodZ family helix-turn-helix domain-containing protein [Mucilaginibacter gilvus]|uniref:Outer membrane protein beta-barrel domain-containing protein n=1 Tax=Mucilaginibacter gilvus TaxID=2305909 RepID=A0A3S3V1A0_9SPHI|nr:hypothetical protein [Mucilaginibacter gilvus]RWY55682.1 hypothetical protein EPL05_04725 [Mucilaginibacter gilvus]